MSRLPCAPLWLSAACLLAALANLPAQTFHYPDFSNTANLTLLGNATTSVAPAATTLRLTANAANQSSWVWRQTPVPVTFGFSTTFTFRLLPSAFGTKGEGLAFVLHGDPLGALATGGIAWGLGYGSGAAAAVGIRKSLVVEIDTYRDLFLADSSDNEVSIHSNGTLGNDEHETKSLGRTTPGTVLSDGLPHTLRVTYLPGTLEVFLDGGAIPILSRTWHHATGGPWAGGGTVGGLALTNDLAFVGFCATTGAGGLTQLAEVQSWQWTSNPPPDPCYQGSLAADLLTVQGQTGGIFRTVRLGVAQSFGIGIASPPAYGPGAPYVLFASIAPQPGALGTQLGFGQTCFPVLPASANELVLADTFGLFAALLPAAPTPYTVPLPAGLVTTPFDFTLQAVIAAASAPLAFGVTNAIDVEFRPSPPPTITLVAPLSAAVGQSITITGTKFLPGLTVAAGGVPAVPTSVTATQVVFPYPAGVTCGSSLTVVNPDGQGATATINPQITITQTALASGPAAGNQTFIMIGTGFAPGTTVTIGGAPATVTTVTTSLVQVLTPPGTPGPRPVVVTSPGGCTATTTYTYF